MAPAKQHFAVGLKIYELKCKVTVSFAALANDQPWDTDKKFQMQPFEPALLLASSRITFPLISL